MKITVKELKTYPKDSEERKQGKFNQHIILFEGEVGNIRCFQLRNYDTSIAMPDFIQFHNDEVIVIYDHPSNVRCELEGDTLWAYPAITGEKLQTLQEKNTKDKATRKENLATIAKE